MMNIIIMSFEIRLLRETFPARGARKGFLARVNGLVFHARGTVRETLPARAARERFFVRVRA